MKLPPFSKKLTKVSTNDFKKEPKGNSDPLEIKNIRSISRST